MSDLILQGIVGSTAYGLAREGSDTDRLGCYVAPTVEFLGLNPPIGKDATRVRHEPSDSTEHEVGKYVSLLLNNNPTVMELLWLPDDLYEIRTEEGEWLISLRSYTLNAKSVRDAYLGYATQQFKRLSERGDGSFSSDTRKRTEKHARHLRRLCWQGFELYTTGNLPIKVEKPEEYFEFGKAVAKDPKVAVGLIRSYEEMFNVATTVLPSEPNRELVENTLVEIRRRHLS